MSGETLLISAVGLGNQLGTGSPRLVNVRLSITVSNGIAAPALVIPNTFIRNITLGGDLQLDLNINSEWGYRLDFTPALRPITSISAGDQATVSNASIRNSAFNIVAEGIKPDTFGADTRVLNASGLLQFNFGELKQEHLPLHFSWTPLRILTSAGGFHAASFGNFKIGQYLSIAPKGFLNTNFSDQHFIASDTPARQLQFDFVEPALAKMALSMAFDQDKRPVIAKGYDFSQIGQPEIKNTSDAIYPNGINDSSFGYPYTYSAKFGGRLVFDLVQVKNQSGVNVAFSFYNPIRDITPAGFIATKFGNTVAIPPGRKIYPVGMGSSFTAGKPAVWNLLQNVRVGVFSSFNFFGQAFLWGGVKTVQPYGIYSQAFGASRVISTNRNISILGIPAPSMGTLHVSPRFLAAQGIKSDAYGQPWVQRNPSPLGFITTGYGNAWVSRSPRYLFPERIEAYLEGYPNIFDPSRKIYPTSVLGTGIFGDIRVRNNRRFLYVPAINSFEPGDWATVFSNRRYIQTGLGEQLEVGEGEIRNKTPSLAPVSIIGALGNPAIGYRVRYIIGRGNDLLGLGIPKLTKPPTIAPFGFNAAAFGGTTVSNFSRFYEVTGFLSLKTGTPNIWYRYRDIKTNGVVHSSVGRPELSHGNRKYDIPSFATLGMGTAWVSFRVRLIGPSSIYKDLPSNHAVGGTQKIDAQGFDAARFGYRIIPESRTIAPQGFAGQFGSSDLQLYKRYLNVTGFKTSDDGYISRWGTAHAYNLRQYVTLNYDPLDGLNPPEWSKWTGVRNRNVSSNITGWNAAKYGYTSVANKARPLLPSGFDMFQPSKPMIGERIRLLKLEGIESPLISTWHTTYNDARVIRAAGIRTDQMGQVERVYNNRRYFPYIGNLFSQEIGTPMIAFRIRGIIGDQRYGIAPPRINLHNVQLYTRYVEPLAHDFYSSGAASLTIKWNIITPRWTLRNDYGYPTVKNLTPELYIRGHNSEEFGDTQVRLQWRPVNSVGSDTSLFGRSKIADRTQRITVSGTNMLIVADKLKVVKTGAPPYSIQFIWLDKTIIDGEEKPSHGIGAPKDQVGTPGFNQNVLYTVSDKPSTAFGQTKIWSNNLMVQPGIGVLDDAVSEPNVRLNTRFVNAESIKSAGGIGNPRLSPWTIYAVIEAPQQARDNHLPSSIHLVKSMSVLGSPVVTNRHRAIQVIWDWRGIYPGVGTPSTQLRKQVIKPIGFNMLRFGWHEIPSKFKDVEQYESSNTMAFGRPALHIPYYGPIKASPLGMSTASYGRPLIEFLNREVKPQGFHSLVMGNSRKSTYEYSPQSLHIGPPMPTKPNAFNTDLYGKPFVSHRVRQVEPASFDSFIATYTLSNFKQRMKVTLANKPNLIVDQAVSVVGINSAGYSVPDIKLAVHYIRPDGNSDQHRKGVLE